MSWHEYYKLPVLTFGKQSEIYQEAINRSIQKDSKIFDLKSPKKIVLGGFHNTRSVVEFKELCKEIFPNRQYYLLDMNKRPLANLNPNDSDKRVQARLENLPFKPGSIDIIFLDFTLTFMSPSQTKKFFKDARQLLATSGLILTTYHDPHSTEITNRKLLKNCYKELGISTYDYTPTELSKLAEPLKQVFYREFETKSPTNPTEALLSVFTNPEPQTDKNKIILNQIIR